MKLTGAAILVSRGMKVLQAAPAAYPCRSTTAMRIPVAVIRAIVLQAVLSGTGAAIGAYAGFRLFLPSEPHCGLAIFPAVFFGGGLGGLIGFAVGLAMATILNESFRRPG